MFCSQCGKERDASISCCPSCGFSGASGPAYAGFWRRVAAAILDGIVVGIVTSPFMMVLALMADIRTPAGEAVYSVLSNSFSILIGVCYYALMESSKWQATLGKLALGLKVTDLQGERITLLRAVGRYAAKYLSAVILLIGFIMVAFTDKKQGLHDKIVNTLVIRK